MNLYKFLFTTFPVIFIRLTLSLIIFKIFSINNQSDFKAFNIYLVVYNFCVILSTLHIGKIIAQNNKMDLKIIKNIIYIPLIMSAIIFIGGLTYYFMLNDNLTFLIITLTTPLSLFTHVVFSINNIELKYIKNNVINLVTLLSLCFFSFFLLYSNYNFELFSNIYFFISTLIPFLAIIVFNPKKLKFYFSIFRIKKNIISRYEIKNLLINNLVYLNPLVIFFVYQFLFDQINFQFSNDFEIYYRAFSMLFSLLAVFMVSYIIPSYKHGVLNLKYVRIIKILIIPFLIVMLFLYKFYINGSFILNTVDVFFICYFVIKLLEFGYLSFMLSHKNFKSIRIYIFDLLIIISILCFY